MIRVQNLRYSYPPIPPDQERVLALDGITLTVERGHCLGVTGANGCGKSTLCLAVAGLAPRLTSGRLEGQIEVAGRDVQATPPGALADVIGLVMQDVSGQLFSATIEDEIAWGLENLGVPAAEIGSRIERALLQVGLEDVSRDQAPQQLSGGEQKRLALAAALALEPAVLILDEPAGGLAPAARTEMVRVLRRLREEQAVTILLAESDPVILVELADDLAILERGRIDEMGTPRAVYRTLDRTLFPGVALPPAAVFTRVLRDAGAAGHEALTVGEAASSLGALSHPAAAPPVPPPPSAPDKPALSIRDLFFAYQPNRPVLNGITLAIPQGQFAALVGDNGAGKTTLARHLIGLIRPTIGQIHVMGRDVSQHSIGELARWIGFAFQNPELQIFNSTVQEEVAFGPRSLGLREGDLDAAVDAALERFGLVKLAHSPPAALSFSARRMVALASIAAMNTPILALDEPTVGLDAAGQQEVIQWLMERHQEGATILLITHDMELAAHAERVIVLDEGHIAADGPPTDVFWQTDLLARAALEPPFAVQLAQRLGDPALTADLTPEGAARAWLGRR